MTGVLVASGLSPAIGWFNNFLWWKTRADGRLPFRPAFHLLRLRNVVWSSHASRSSAGKRWTTGPTGSSKKVLTPAPALVASPTTSCCWPPCPAGLVRNSASLSSFRGDTLEAGRQADAQGLRLACPCSSRARTCSLCRNRGPSLTAWARCEAQEVPDRCGSSAHPRARARRLRRLHCSSARLPGKLPPEQEQDWLLADPQNVLPAAPRHRQPALENPPSPRLRRRSG